MNRAFDVIVLVVWGTIIADLVTHPQGTGTLTNGLSNLWGQSLNAVKGG